MVNVLIIEKNFTLQQESYLQFVFARAYFRANLQLTLFSGRWYYRNLMVVH